MWIKICGLTDAEAVAAALAARVDALGFVFAPSVRQLTPAQAALLAAPARSRVRLIAVTLHPSQQLIDEIVTVFAPDVLQSDQEDFARLRLPPALAQLPVLRSREASGSPVSSEPAVPLPEQILFESGRSGSGTRADWTQATQLALRTRLVLAGGLSASNVAEAIRAVRPYGVDVSSGVESAPGRKNPTLIRQFVDLARAAEREPAAIPEDVP
jgi:phosphoribosylanthranilate isomerase